MASRPMELISKLRLKERSGISLTINGMSLPIFLCTDNNYAVPAYITMYSLLVNYTGTEKLRLYLLTSNDFESRYIHLFKSLKGNYELQIINMQNSFDEVVINTSWITTATMYRLLIPKIARGLNIEKCIYLDSDIVVEGDISELFNIEIEGFCIGAVKERLISCDRDSELRGLLGVSNLRDYINAGVLLFNLIEIEKEGLSEKLEEAGHRTEYPHNDQDAINAVFHNRIHLLPIRFNAINAYLYDRKKDTENEYGSEAIQQARKDPIIIHYIGKCKPWASRGTILAERWWRYVRMQEKSIRTEYFKPFAKASKLAPKKRLKEMIKATTMKMDIYKPVRKFYHTIKRIVGYPAAKPWDF